MIYLNDVTDNPHVFGERHSLLSRVDFVLPRGRYVLLSQHPQRHRSLIDVMTGLRSPRSGRVSHAGQVSWPIGRQAFIRGKASGLRMMKLVCALYGIEYAGCVEFVSDLITSPEYLQRPMEDWPLPMRQEFAFALALVPAFDVYVIEGVIPFEANRFSRLWLALFEERLVGRTLLLSTYRQDQVMDYCTRALVLEEGQLRMENDVEACLKQFPLRRFRVDADHSEEHPLTEDISGENLGI